MATAKQLPSGKWRVQVYDKETGKRVSFTAETKRKADLLAIEWQEGKRDRIRRGITLGEAVDKYIEGRDGVLSPSTIQGYRKMRKCYLSDELAEVPVKNLTSELMQGEIKRLSRVMSAKTVHNYYGLITASLSEVNADIKLKVSLPNIQKKFIELPPVEDVIAAVKGTNIELPAMLSMWLSLSVSEIRGIRIDSIKDGVLTIRESVVQVDGEAVHKESTKAFERTRRLTVPPYIMGLIQQTDAYKTGAGYIETRSGDSIRMRFRRVIKNAGLPHMSFHQLRHMNASVMAMLNVPEKYAQERGGWKTPHTMKRVYQHTFSKERTKVDETIDTYFEELVDKKTAHGIAHDA